MVYVDLSEDEEAIILASLDPLAAMAATDKAKLEELLHEVSASDARVQQMMSDLAEREHLQFGAEPPADVEPQIDKAEELRVKWGVETGQLWQLGEHRLICGDCTDRTVVDRVMAGEKAQVAMTSPPYGVGKSYETKGIAPWFETVRPVIQNLAYFASVVIWQLGDLYSTGGQFIEPTLAYSINMFAENGMKPLWIRIWEKQGTNYGVGPYHLQANNQYILHN